jgi:hypothetical protein
MASAMSPTSREVAALSSPVTAAIWSSSATTAPNEGAPCGSGAGSRAPASLIELMF